MEDLTADIMYLAEMEAEDGAEEEEMEEEEVVVVGDVEIIHFISLRWVELTCARDIYKCIVVTT